MPSQERRQSAMAAQRAAALSIGVLALCGGVRGNWWTTRLQDGTAGVGGSADDLVGIMDLSGSLYDIGNPSLPSFDDTAIDCGADKRLLAVSEGLVYCANGNVINVRPGATHLAPYPTLALGDGGSTPLSAASSPWGPYVAFRTAGVVHFVRPIFGDDGESPDVTAWVNGTVAASDVQDMAVGRDCVYLATTTRIEVRAVVDTSTGSGDGGGVFAAPTVHDIYADGGHNETAELVAFRPYLLKGRGCATQVYYVTGELDAATATHELFLNAAHIGAEPHMRKKVPTGAYDASTVRKAGEEGGVAVETHSHIMFIMLPHAVVAFDMAEQTFFEPISARQAVKMVTAQGTKEHPLLRTDTEPRRMYYFLQLAGGFTTLEQQGSRMVQVAQCPLEDEVLGLLGFNTAGAPAENSMLLYYTACGYTVLDIHVPAAVALVRREGECDDSKIVWADKIGAPEGDVAFVMRSDGVLTLLPHLQDATAAAVAVALPSSVHCLKEGAGHAVTVSASGTRFVACWTRPSDPSAGVEVFVLPGSGGAARVALPADEGAKLGALNTEGCFHTTGAAVVLSVTSRDSRYLLAVGEAGVSLSNIVYLVNADLKAYAASRLSLDATGVADMFIRNIYMPHADSTVASKGTWMDDMWFLHLTADPKADGSSTELVIMYDKTDTRINSFSYTGHRPKGSDLQVIGNADGVFSVFAATNGGATFGEYILDNAGGTVPLAASYATKGSSAKHRSIMAFFVDHQGAGQEHTVFYSLSTAVEEAVLRQVATSTAAPQTEIPTTGSPLSVPALHDTPAPLTPVPGAPLVQIHTEKSGMRTSVTVAMVFISCVIAVFASAHIRRKRRERIADASGDYEMVLVS